MRFLSLFLVIAILLSGCHMHTGEPLSTTTSMTTEAPVPAFTTPAYEETEMPKDTTSTATEPTVPTEPVFNPYTIIETMSIDALVGQLFLARCPDTNSVEDIAEFHLGGFVLFGRDFANETPSTIRSQIDIYQSASQIPMLIATDEEGGTVTRVSSYSQFRASRFSSPRNLYNNGGIDLILETELEKCQLLKSLGINVNLGPVCDITTDQESFMYKRSLGESPAVTGAFAAEVCNLMKQEKLGSVLKHFPGYGNNVDTHTGIARDSRSLEQLEASDLVPFRAGIAAGCDGILVSHTIVEALDPELPASLSPDVNRHLRKDLGFDGVIITDDLIMEAITDQFGAEEAAILAILAGSDMLCSSEYQIQYKAVLDAVNSGRIPLEQIYESVARILKWKHCLGLIENET